MHTLRIGKLVFSAPTARKLRATVRQVQSAAERLHALLDSLATRYTPAKQSCKSYPKEQKEAASVKAYLARTGFARLRMTNEELKSGKTLEQVAIERLRAMDAGKR
jgi:uncharacterized protein YkwD